MFSENIIENYAEFKRLRYFTEIKHAMTTLFYKCIPKFKK